MANTNTAIQSQHAQPYHLTRNDDDWIHRTFAEAWDKQQRLQDLDGVQREHTLYGPQNTRLSWIYPPSHRFLVKPQSLLMPEVFLDDPDAVDTSMTSTQAVDGDASHDSMGAPVISQWRDVFHMRGRREVDLIVVKKLLDGPQIPLLVVELKRDDLDRLDAAEQIEDYMKRILIRCKALGHSHAVYGLLVMGKWSLRIRGVWNGNMIELSYLDVNVVGNPVCVQTDSTRINRWLLEQAHMWLDI